MNKIKKQALNIVLESLKNNPEDWKFTRYEATNKKIKANIWLENRYYFTTMNLGPVMVGGLACFWMFCPWEWWRVSLIKAVENAQFEQWNKSVKES